VFYFTRNHGLSLTCVRRDRCVSADCGSIFKSEEGFRLC